MSETGLKATAEDVYVAIDPKKSTSSMGFLTESNSVVSLRMAALHSLCS